MTPDRSAPEGLEETRVWEVLDAHGGYRAAGLVGAGWECICGEHLSQWWPEGGCRPFETAIDVALRAHLAEALAPTVQAYAEQVAAERLAGVTQVVRDEVDMDGTIDAVGVRRLRAALHPAAGGDGTIGE